MARGRAERMPIESRIEALNGDWQLVKNQRYCAAVTSKVTNSSAEVFKEKVRRVIHRAEGLHVYGDFCDLTWSTSCCSDVRLCQSAYNSDVPDQQLSRAPWYLRHSVRTFAISSWNADWFFGRRDARQHQSSRNHVIKLLMSGYSARLFYYYF